MTIAQPVIPVEIVLGEPLTSPVVSSGVVADEVGLRLDRLVSDVGVPGRVQVTVHNDRSAARPVEIRVHSRRLEYPRSLDQLVLVMWRHRVEGETTAGVALPTWYEQVASAAADTAGLVAELAMHAIVTKPSALLGAPQVTAWREAVAESPVGDGIGEVLRLVLDLRLSIADRERIANLVSRFSDVTAADAAEHVVEALRSATLDVRVEPGYLEEITTMGPDSNLDVFPYLRDNLYIELGLRLPGLRLVPDSNLAPRCFAFRVNDLTTPPVLGLPPDMRLVNASVEQLAGVVPGARAALNPALDMPSAIVPAVAREKLESQGYTTWDPLGYLIFTLAETARLHARALVDRKTVARELELAGYLLPTLINAAQAKVPVDRLTRLLRSLVDEQVPVRNLCGLLQRLVHQAAIDSLPESDDDLLEFARRASQLSITDRAAQWNGNIVAYVLTSKLEADIMASAATTTEDDEEMCRAVVAALETELAQLSGTTTPPVLLTTSSARLPIRRAIRATWPRLMVLAYDELDAMANVMPVARLGSTTP